MDGQRDALPSDVEQRSLLGTLGGDLNTIVTSTIQAVAGTYAVKRIWNSGGDGKDGGDQDVSPPA